jgi:hypothetical protein
MNKELIWGETPFELEDTFSLTDGELGVLDTATVDYLCAFPAYIDDLFINGSIEKNELYPEAGTHLWVKNISVKKEGSARCTATLSLIGQMAGWDERRSRVLSAFGAVVSIGPIEKVIIVTTASETGEDPEDDSEVPAKRRIPKLDAEGEVEYKTITTPSGSAERWNINDPSVKIVDTYFVIEEPTSVEIGTAFTPLTPPTPPADQWVSYDEPKRANHPNGWVLDDRQIIVIIPEKCWQVTDTIGYYQASVPD